MSRQPQVRGFTILELMLVVGIISIMAGMAIGYAGSYRHEEGLKEVARNVVAALGQGRAEAVRTSTKVSVNFGKQRIYAFLDQNGNYVYDAGEKIIFQYPPRYYDGNTEVNSFGISPNLPTGVTVTTAASLPLSVSNPSGAVTAIFDYQGYSQDYQGNPVAAILCVKDTSLPKEARAVYLTVAGASRVQSYAAGLAMCP